MVLRVLSHKPSGFMKFSFSSRTDYKYKCVIEELVEYLPPY